MSDSKEMTVVEQVARAICCPDGCAGDTGSGKPCDIGREDGTSMHQARAAIKAYAKAIAEVSVE